MPQSLSRVALHLIFSTRERALALADAQLRYNLEGYIVGILKNLGCPSIATKAVEDHVHILFFLSRTETISHVVQLVKQESSKWVKTWEGGSANPYLQGFHWQQGYGVFSVSESKIDVVKRYVEDQEEHHKGQTFQEEFRRFLQKHGVDFDERYVWD